MVTVDDVIGRLESRAYKHGLEVGDLLEKIPSDVRDCHEEVNEWLDTKDVSHKMPVSTHPHLQSDPDNVMWEDSDINRARGAQPMTETEILTAQLDNELDARMIDDNSLPDADWIDVLVANDVDTDFDFPEQSPMFW